MSFVCLCWNTTYWMSSQNVNAEDQTLRMLIPDQDDYFSRVPKIKKQNAVQTPELSYQTALSHTDWDSMTKIGIWLPEYLRSLSKPDA